LAISPPSDIILDVAKAADPLQYRAAVEKLARLSDVEASATASFDALLGSFSPESAATSDVADPLRADLRSHLAPIQSGGAETAETKAKAPYRQFESFVLQTFIQQMLPKDASHVFGEGLAGSFWSSMLAEQIAGQMSKAGGIGIADIMASREGAGATSSALPGYMTSLERGFADSVLPTGDEGDDSLLSTDES
jgi:peptidoglycan hydrolase FlgJ